MIDEARAVVDGAVQRGFGGDGWIWISNHFAEGYPTKFFMRGWQSASDWVIWSRENNAFSCCRSTRNSPRGGSGLELQLHLALPEPAHQTRLRSEFVSTMDLSSISTYRLTMRS